MTDIFEQIQRRREAVRSNIEKGFNATPFSVSVDDAEIEKAYQVGDLFTDANGKMYIWTEYAPGKFDWHVVNKRRVVEGKGFNGKHGAAGVQAAFEKVDKAFTDINKMALKRTPNGLWRLWYDNADAGSAIDGDCFTEAELKNSNVCYQNRMVVDNFERMKSYLEFNSPDDVYFVQIIKRWKDNKDKPGADAWKAQGKAQGTYHAGAEYLNYWLVHSTAELDSLKNQIVKLCTYNNARAYISINSRNETATKQFIAQEARKLNPQSQEYQRLEPVKFGQAKSGPNWRNERFKVLLDVDATRDATCKINGKTVNVWDETRRRLAYYGIKIATEYETPSGGLHLILNNKNNRNLKPFYSGLKEFDGGQDLKTNATVHPTEDAKMVLYSNVSTGGY